MISAHPLRQLSACVSCSTRILQFGIDWTVERAAPSPVPNGEGPGRPSLCSGRVIGVGLHAEATAIPSFQTENPLINVAF